MNRSIWSAILLVSVLGVAAARAGDTAKKPAAVKPTQGIMTEVVAESSDASVEEKRGLGKLRPKEIKERAQMRRESRTPHGCYGHFNDYSCNSLHSTCQFLFGSCRTFFGEACLKGPPPSPVPGFDPYAQGLDRRTGRCPGCR